MAARGHGLTRGHEREKKRGRREGGGEEANVEECEGCERKVKSKGGEGGSEAEGKGTEVSMG